MEQCILLRVRRLGTVPAPRLPVVTLGIHECGLLQGRLP